MSLSEEPCMICQMMTAMMTAQSVMLRIIDFICLFCTLNLWLNEITCFSHRLGNLLVLLGFQ